MDIYIDGRQQKTCAGVVLEIFIGVIGVNDLRKIEAGSVIYI